MTKRKIIEFTFEQNLDWKKYEHRFDAVQRAMEQRRSIAQGYLITGHLDEKNFGKKWLEKVLCFFLLLLLISSNDIFAS